jgi:hypothetical protein
LRGLKDDPERANLNAIVADWREVRPLLSDVDRDLTAERVRAAVAIGDLNGARLALRSARELADVVATA